MAISYSKLWKILIDKKMNKGDLCYAIGLSSSTMAKMTKEESVSLSVLERICSELSCNIGDIMEFVDLEKHKKGN